MDVIEKDTKLLQIEVKKTQSLIEQDHSVQDAKWLFAFVGGIGMVVFVVGMFAVALGG